MLRSKEMPCDGIFDQNGGGWIKSLKKEGPNSEKEVYDKDETFDLTISTRF